MNYGLSDILTLLGSLGLFLYGMKSMSHALEKLAGYKMRSILAATTANRFFALLTGFFITATIQSSSATTMMVVSFVNAGLLTLTEAVGVIMGANIGTTITAWLITLLGFKVKMTAIAIPLAGLGFLFSLSKKPKHQQLGFFIIGFAILFIGLEFLKNSVPDIVNNPQILQSLAEYTNQGYFSIILFMAFGTLLTLVIQSSSATMALTLVMAYEGWIPFDIAAAIVLGENIGTTITANLAAIVTNFQAKRAARAHFIFNMLGVVWMLLLFYPFIQFIAGIVIRIEGASPFYSTLAIPVALSLFHTCFNVLNALLLIGFVPLIVRFVEKIVPEEKEREIEFSHPKYLTTDSMNYSPTAIKSLQDESLRLLENTTYRVIAHGMGVHCKDLDSDKKLSQIIDDSSVIDIDKVYRTQVKAIYSQILEYATTLQALHALDEEDIVSIHNILMADRKLLQVVKKVKPVRDNIKYYMETDNITIRHEYNLLRYRILKITRMVHRLAQSQQSVNYFEILRKQRDNLRLLDVLHNGRVDTLLMTDEINREMALSLVNDSVNTIRLTQNLIDAALILYAPEGEQLNISAENYL